MNTMSNRFLITEGIYTRASDTYYGLRLVKTLVTPWEQLPAHKSGVIDKSGKIMISPDKRTPAQKDSFTLFDSVVFKIKRLAEKIPGYKSTLGRLYTAIKLLREESEEDYKYLLENFDNEQEMIDILTEMDSSAMAGNETTQIDSPQFALGQPVKRKPVVPDDIQVGQAVFDVDSDAFVTSRLGKPKYLKYATFVGNTPEGKKIRDFGLQNPGKKIIVRHKDSGLMQYLR